MENWMIPFMVAMSTMIAAFAYAVSIYGTG